MPYICGTGPLQHKYLAGELLAKLVLLQEGSAVHVLERSCRRQLACRTQCKVSHSHSHNGNKTCPRSLLKAEVVPTTTDTSVNNITLSILVVPIHATACVTLVVGDSIFAARLVALGDHRLLRLRNGTGSNGAVGTGVLLRLRRRQALGLEQYTKAVEQRTVTGWYVTALGAKLLPTSLAVH